MPRPWSTPASSTDSGGSLSSLYTCFYPLPLPLTDSLKSNPTSAHNIHIYILIQPRIEPYASASFHFLHSFFPLSLCFSPVLVLSECSPARKVQVASETCVQESRIRVHTYVDRVSRNALLKILPGENTREQLNVFFSSRNPRTLHLFSLLVIFFFYEWTKF